MFPSIKQYKESVENSFFPLKEKDPSLFFIPCKDEDGKVIFSSGGFSVVFKVKDANGDIKALKLFLQEIDYKVKRFDSILDFFHNNKSSFFIDFKFEEKLIYVNQGSENYEDDIFPGIIMDWVEGKSLTVYIKQLCLENNSFEIGNLANKFKKLAFELLSLGIAHGDLKPDNIIIDNKGNLKLIDYDGFFIPSMKGEKTLENGTSSFQHPMRSDNDFNENLDHFSILSIYLSLLLLEHNPLLFEKYNDDQNLLFKQSDFLNTKESKLFRYIDNINNNPAIKGLSLFLLESLESDNIEIADLVKKIEKKYDVPSIIISHSPEQFIEEQPIVLRWETKNCDFIIIDNKEYDVNGEITLYLKDEHTFNIKYGNSLQVSTNKYTIYPVPSPRITYFVNKKQNELLSDGQTTVLEWNASFYSKLILSFNGQEYDVTKNSAFESAQLFGNTKFRLTAVSLSGLNTVYSELEVRIFKKVKIISFKSDPKYTIPDRPITLKWDVEHADYLFLEPEGIDVSGKTEVTIVPRETTRYTLTAKNEKFSDNSTCLIKVIPVPFEKFTFPEAPRVDNILQGQYFTIPNVDLNINIDKDVLNKTLGIKEEVEVQEPLTWKNFFTAFKINGKSLKTIFDIKLLKLLPFKTDLLLSNYLFTRQYYSLALNIFVISLLSAFSVLFAVNSYLGIYLFFLLPIAYLQYKLTSLFYKNMLKVFISKINDIPKFFFSSILLLIVSYCITALSLSLLIFKENLVLMGLPYDYTLFHDMSFMTYLERIVMYWPELMKGLGITQIEKFMQIGILILIFIIYMIPILIFCVNNHQAYKVANKRLQND